MSISRQDEAKHNCTVGKEYHLYKEYDIAIQAYTNAISIDPTYLEAYYCRGISYQETKLNQKALKDFRMVLNNHPDDQLKLKALYQIALIYYYRQNFNHTIHYMTQYLTLNSKNSHAFYIRANARFKQESYESALDDYNEAIKLEQNNHKYYINRGSTLKKMGNLAAAIADWTTAIKLAPNKPNAYFNRGLTYYENNRIEAAKQDMIQSILCDLTSCDISQHKEIAFDIIKALPNDLAILLFKSCLDKTTELGKLFWEQRGFTEPDVYHGMLDQVVLELRERHAKFRIYESVEALTSKTSPYCRFFPRPRPDNQQPVDYCNNVVDHMIHPL